MPCKKGHPISAYYGYLVGVTNKLAEKHLPDVKPRLDTDGGQPQGRRADQVGGTLLVHRDDITQYMHDWLKITEDVRFDPEVRLPRLLCSLCASLPVLNISNVHMLFVGYYERESAVAYNPANCLNDVNLM